MVQIRKKISLEEFERYFPDANLKDLGQDSVNVLFELTPLAYELYDPETKECYVVKYNGPKIKYHE